MIVKEEILKSIPREKPGPFRFHKGYSFTCLGGVRFHRQVTIYISNQAKDQWFIRFVERLLVEILCNPHYGIPPSPKINTFIKRFLRFVKSELFYCLAVKYYAAVIGTKGFLKNAACY
jgi:hypothetical protein